jgi:hypothetical protein
MSSASAIDQVFEHDGLLWKRRPGAKSTFEELAAARTFFQETHEAAGWDPWLRDDRADELDAAMAVMQEWTRAEPDFRQWTAQETEEWLEEGQRRREADEAALQARWETDKSRFDPDIFAARCALLEQKSIQAHIESELDEFRSGRRYPAMAAARRGQEIADLEEKLGRCAATLVGLRETVGDPELVVNKLGQLPHDRRYANLLSFKYEREHEVRELRRRLPELRAELKATNDKEERKKLREQVSRDEQELAYWLGVGPLVADDMCSECATPLSGHGWVSRGLHGAAPCPAWPGWAARMNKVREMLLEAAERRQQSPVPPPLPKPEPIAVIASGLPLSEVVARLSELQKQYPDAVVKRGRANRWELWPPESGQ